MPTKQNRYLPAELRTRGLTYRRVNHWLERIPEIRVEGDRNPGSGNHREWEQDTIDDLLIAADVIDTVGDINAARMALRAAHNEGPGWVALRVTEPRNGHFGATWAATTFHDTQQLVDYLTLTAAAVIYAR